MSVILAGLVAFAAGAAVSCYELRRVSSRIGWTWEEWNSAPYIGGRWWWVFKPATVILMFLGIAGFFLPGWVRVGILAAIFGFCAPFFLTGVLLRARG
jgi:hypothetical protein